MVVCCLAHCAQECQLPAVAPEPPLGAKLDSKTKPQAVQLAQPDESESLQEGLQEAHSA
jgi:hypothetical protein